MDIHPYWIFRLDILIRRLGTVKFSSAKRIALFSEIGSN